MSPYSEDNEILNTLSKILNLEEQLNTFLVPIEKKKLLEEERKKLITEYDHLLIGLNRIEIRHSPDEKAFVKLLRYILKHDCDLNKIWDYYYEYILDFHMDDELLNRGEFLNNYYALRPPYVKVGTEIPQGIKNIYHESRWCFVYGQYSASVTLSRTVIETILKHKFNLEGDIKDIINFAHEKRFISKKCAWSANKVRMLANKILHKADVATKKQAMNALDHVLDFIEEIYFD
jgi:hypothetical protein